MLIQSSATEEQDLIIPSELLFRDKNETSGLRALTIERLQGKTYAPVYLTARGFATSHGIVM